MRLYLVFLLTVYSLCCGQYAIAQDYQGKRVFILHSYDENYPWTQGINQAALSVLEGNGIVSTVFYMNTKNRASESEKTEAATAAKAEIEKFEPDVVIVSDDDAVKYVLMPFYKNSPIPFVFCGVNWDASEYALPYSNTTGMLEIELLDSIVKQVKENTRKFQTRIGTLALNGFTEHKRVDKYREHLGSKILNKSYFPNNFEEWKRDFLKLQDEVDMILMLNARGMKDWNMPQAEQFLLENIKIPSASATEWMSPLSLLGITLVPEEQGTWAAQAALKIMGGQAPNTIPISRNQDGKLFVNLKIAEKLGVAIKPSLMRLGKIIR
ncbi:MAG: ABC transporter substrate binding protein [Thiotrichaceae bacterium]|nr:ABC transporter substrate binding protein [Thiotrichaceae bacterium]